jgi:hypothetical protein
VTGTCFAPAVWISLFMNPCAKKSFPDSDIPFS